MNEWCFYIALYSVLLYTQSALQSCGGVSPQPPPVCSIHLDDATAATGQRRQCARHTLATGGEERVIEPIKWMGIIKRPWLIKASGGNSVRTPEVTPLLFTRSAMGFLMTTESQDLGLTSLLKHKCVSFESTDQVGEVGQDQSSFLIGYNKKIGIWFFW